MERRTLNGVHFIRVHGTVVERARAHAALLKEEIRNGAMPALARKNEWLIRKGGGVLDFKPVQNAVVWLYRKGLLTWMDRFNDEETNSVLRVMAEETGLSYELCRESFFQPDVLMLLSRISVMKHVMPEYPPGGMPGCTSGVIARNWTASGRMLACRNQDYPMVGPWERGTTVIFHEPSESDQIPHVAITTAGVHTAGLTAINREGITVFTHAHFGRRVRLSGKPVVTIGNEIARKARTLDEAIDLARKNLPCANWAFVVASAKEQAAIVIEMNPDKAAVRHAEDGFIAHSNYFHDKELREDEALISGGICEDLEGRLCRLRDILEADRGRLEPSHLSRALGDHVDHFTGEERVYGNTISVVTTIKSTVFDPEQQRFWISTRGESPMGLGEFMEVDIDRFWKDKPEETLARKKIPGYTPKKPGLLEGIHHYREAYREWHMNCHEPDFAERCYIALKKATRAFPSDPNVWFQAGIVALKLHKFDEARNCFEQSLPFKTARHVTEVRNLYLARCYDLAGERAKALDIYGRFSQIGEPRLRKAYEHGMRRPYRERDTARMMLDLQFPDTLQY